MRKKIVTILVVLLVWFVHSGGVTFSSVQHRVLQTDSSQTVLVGGLDLGIQTGSFSNASYVLSVGFLNIPKTAALPADFNADGAVNFSDFLIFASGFGRRQSDPAYNNSLDLNQDGEVGFSDFLIFAAAFTG